MLCQSDNRSPLSPTIHGGLLAVALDLLSSAQEMQDRGREETIHKSRLQSAAVMALLCTILEAAINVYADHFFSGPGADVAAEAKWPDMWLHHGGHSTRTKWQSWAHRIAGEGFAAGIPNWGNRLAELFGIRNEIVHFKGRHGRWGSPSDLVVASDALSLDNAMEWFSFTRELVASLARGYESAHQAREVRHASPWGPQGPLNLPVEPIAGATAGTYGQSFSYGPDEPSAPDGPIDA